MGAKVEKQMGSESGGNLCFSLCLKTLISGPYILYIYTALLLYELPHLC